MSQSIDFRNPPPEGTLFRHKGEIYKLDGVSVTEGFSQKACDLINSGQMSHEEAFLRLTNGDQAWRQQGHVTTTYVVGAYSWDPEMTHWYKCVFARFHDDGRQPRCVTGVKSLPVHTPTEETK